VVLEVLKKRANHYLVNNHHWQAITSLPLATDEPPFERL
jgi:hypothetical protein